MDDITISSCEGERLSISGTRKKWATGIYNSSRKLNVSGSLQRRAGIAGLMTAIVESKLLMYANSSVPASLGYPHDAVGSDHDSLGLMQQRPSSGWGSVAELMNAEYNAAAFYGGKNGPNSGSPRGLLDISGWEQGDLGKLCQRVQVSAFPDRYACWQAGATKLYDHIAGTGGVDDGEDTPGGDDELPNPISIERWGSDLLLRMDDGTSRRALSMQGDFWKISEVAADNPTPPPPTGTRFVWPFSLTLVTSEFGPRWGRLHAGIDFGKGAANTSGTAIPAASSGKVIIAKQGHGGYGNAVVLDHGGGLCTLYGHMRYLPSGAPDISVKVGDIVKQGQRLGGIGKTGRSYGNHLHFETHEGGYRWNESARDPRKFFAKWNS